MTAASQNSFSSRLLAAMQRNNFTVFEGPDVVNIIYVEGMDPDGTPNEAEPNKFDDLRCLVRVIAGQPLLLGKWDATTKPGRYWTQHRMNPAGAFIIALGQQTAWTVGTYHDMPALIQSGPLKHYRDSKNDYKREGKLYIDDDTGVHHHGGYDYPHDDLGRSSAGCLVGRSMFGHQKFMDIVRTDARYHASHSFMFTATVLTAADVIGDVA